MTTAQVVETSVTISNSPIQDYVHPDDHTQPTYEMTPGFKPFQCFICCRRFQMHILLTVSSVMCALQLWVSSTHIIIKIYAQMVKQLGFCPKTSTVPNNPDQK